MHVSDSNDIPFDGFSLKHSTSFSSEHDEADAIAAAEDAVFQGTPISLQQKYTKQNYHEMDLSLMQQKGHQPLERKPFVFEAKEKPKVISSRINPVKRASEECP